MPEREPMPPKDILDTMLGFLGFGADIQESYDEAGHLTLQIYMNEPGRLIGPHGETLHNLQTLLNRILNSTDPNAPRVTVDIEHYRTMRQDGLLSRVMARAERVRLTGRPITLEPMNSYDRRIIHNAFKDDPELEASSPPGDRRMKSMTIRRRRTGNPHRNDPAGQSNKSEPKVGQ